MGGRGPLEVAVLSPHGLTRAGVTHLVSSRPDRARVVDLAALEDAREQYHVVLYDLAGLEDGNDLAQLVAAGPPVVGLVPTGRADLSARGFELGVADVVRMDVSPDDLVAALERVATGVRASGREHRAQLLGELAARTGLTVRELEVLSLIAEGLTNKEVAARLFLSVNSIKTYVRTAYRRIGATSRSEAVLWAVGHGLGGLSRPVG